MVKNLNFIFALNLIFIFSLCSITKAEKYETSTLQVSGNGEVTTKPDVAYINIGIETHTKSAEEAVEANSERTLNVIKSIKKSIGPKDKVQTSNYNLTPTYEYDKELKKSTISGYRVINEIVVETYEIENLGNLIDITAKLGANRISGPQFNVSDKDNYIRQALVEAVQDARKTAEIVSTASGTKIVKILSISPNYNFPFPYNQRYGEKMVMAESPSTPIEIGDIKITAKVNIIYEIQ